LEVQVSYESTAEPIKVGYLMDFTLPPGFADEMKADFTQCFDVVFDEAVEQGLLDRPVQMIQGTGHQRHRDRRLARRVDVRFPAGVDDRRAHIFGRPGHKARDQ
jgi:hypothetical protein